MEFKTFLYRKRRFDEILLSRKVILEVRVTLDLRTRKSDIQMFNTSHANDPLNHRKKS